MRVHHICAPVLLVLLATGAKSYAQELQVHLVGDQLQLQAPGLHFLTGKPLEQLRTGASVAFDIQVSILADSRQTLVTRIFDRFVLSYDIWEERYSVGRLRSTRSSARNLTAPAAEAWCVGRLNVGTGGLPADKPFWVRIDIRPGELREKGTFDLGDGSFSLASLIEIFSRPAKARTPQWRIESAPIMLASLRSAAP